MRPCKSALHIQSILLEKQSQISFVYLWKMSCYDCRILRKGCIDNCIFRQCFRGIEALSLKPMPLFLAKFFAHANFMFFSSQQFTRGQSLLFEACGRTVNKVNGGAAGLLWTGNWLVCQSAVETVFCDDGSPASERNINLFKSHGLREERNEMSRSIAHSKNDVDVVFTSSLLSIVMTGGRTKRHAERLEELETTTLESGSGCSNRSLQGQGERKLLKLFI